MLCLIPILGGLLLMMGQPDRSEALFYYFRLEDQVAENHLLRLIEKHISFEFVRQRLEKPLRRRTQSTKNNFYKNQIRYPVFFKGVQSSKWDSSLRKLELHKNSSW
jgi:hypothetical protein